MAVGQSAGEERKVVTVLFCDLVGSTELSGMLDPEPLRAILLGYYTLMEERIEAHTGTVEKFIGDAVMAVFGLTATHEDDARRALAAALALRDALAGFNGALERDHGVRLAIRVGVHTGEVVTTADPTRRQALVSGEVVNIAARLQGQAAAGEVLISAATRRAAGAPLVVSEVGPLGLKGVGAPVEAFRLTAVPPSDPEAMRRFDTPFVGRARELSTLDLAWGRVAEQNDAQVVTLLGEAGMGKTRLVTEWLKRRAEAAPLVGLGRCPATRVDGSLRPLAECLAPLVTLAEADPAPMLATAVAVLRAGLLLDGTPSPSPEESGAAVAQVLTALAFHQPLLLIIDDCQWAEPMLLDVLSRLAEDLDRLPVMLLCLARPELIDVYPNWNSGRTNTTTMTMAGLPAAESNLLAATLVDVVPHEPDTLAQIVAQADGNPLYLEQLATAVTEQGATPDRLPPNLQALIAARIDRLGNAERTVLRHAAVIGPEFDLDHLCELAAAPADPRSWVAVVRTLVRRRFIEPLRGQPGTPSKYRFVNAVTQRVAYEGMTKRRRGELHERCAERFAGRQPADALVGDHLERAYRYYLDIGSRNESTAGLRRRAATSLAAAGALALRRVDLPRAKDLLTRAAGLTEPGDPGRAECLQRLGEAWLTLGHLAEARQALRQALAEAGEQGLAVTAAHARLHLAMTNGGEGGLAAAAERAMPVFTSAGDQLGLTRSQLILAGYHQRRGHHAEALGILDNALAHSLAAEADRELANALGAIGLALWHGPEPAAAAIERCEALLTAYGPGRHAVRATLGFPLTVLYALHGDAEAAAGRLAETHGAMAALSYAESRVFRPLLTGLVALAAGAEPAAEPPLREALREARALGIAGLARIAALELARVWLAEDRWPEADELAAGLEIGRDDPADLANQLGIRALASALRDDQVRAARLAGEAVTVARRTDSRAGQARALLDLARVRSLAASAPAARTAAEEALELFSAKGHLVGADRARRLLAGVGLAERGGSS